MSESESEETTPQTIQKTPPRKFRKRSKHNDDDDEDDDDSVQPMEVESPHRPPSAALVVPVVPPEVPEAPFVPRKWQLSPAAARDCFMAYTEWLQLYYPFSTAQVTDDAEIIAQRQETLEDLVKKLYNVWKYGCSPENAPANKVDAQGIAWCLLVGPNFDFELNQSTLDTHLETLQKPIVNMMELHRTYRFCDPSNPTHNNSLSKLNSVLKALLNGYRMFSHACAMQLALDPSTAECESSRNVLFYVDNFQLTAERIEDAKDPQKLILYMITVAAQKRYRRHRDSVYEEVVTPEGFRTHFWHRICSMKEFILMECTRENNYEMCMISSEPRSFHCAHDFLCKMHDLEFPFIHIDRHVFSFRNGIYFAANRYFRRYAEGQINWGVDSNFVSRKSSFGFVQQRRFFLTNASANYFDLEFREYLTWESIATPTVDKMLNDQALSEEVQKVVGGMLGRLIYEVGELDDWQVILWFLGRGGSGKSSLCKLVQLFYQKEDVAVISNEIEEKFGLESVYDKLAFIAPDIKRDFKLSQAQFQSMVSGEAVSVAQKHKIAEHIQAWRVPGMMAANEMPSWSDNSDSVSRRVLMVNFTKPILRVDGQLEHKLTMEAAAIISKANQAYHHMVRAYGTSGIWENLPEYFIKMRNKIKNQTHPLHNFLNSNEVTKGANLYCSWDTFRATARAYIQKCGLKNIRWTEDVYGVPLEEHKLRLETAEEIEWPMGSGTIARNLRILRGIEVKLAPPTHNMVPVQQLYQKSALGGPSPLRNQDGGKGRLPPPL